MKTVKQIEKMLEGYIVGRPVSRTRNINGYTVFLKSEHGVMTIYAYNQDTEHRVEPKVIYNNWFKAFDYYYNEIEKILAS